MNGEVKKHEKKMCFTDMPSRISDLSECLGKAVGRAEPDFMKIGGGLQSVYSTAKDLTKKTIQAVEFISTESEGSVLVKIKKVVKGSLLELENCQTGLSDHLQYGSAVADHLGDLYKLIAGIKKIARSLSVLGVHTRIESSRSSEMFDVVAREIKQVSEKIGELSQNIHDDVIIDQQKQVSANGEIADGLSQLGKLAESAEKAVKGTVREIEQIAAFSSNILEQGAFRSKKISQQIGVLVVSIQFYDSMHQRIEHIVTALHDVESALKNEISAFQSDKATLPKTGASHSILAVQTAQLGRIISEIEKVYRQSKNAFETLIKEVDRLAVDFSTHDTGTSRFRESRTSDAFEMLGSSLQNLHGILLHGHTLYERMEKAAVRASLTANKLSEQNRHVQSISLDTHILALNSIIKAEHMGDKGKNMKVLAHEIADLSDRTNTFVSNVEKCLESIISLCRKLHITQPGKTQKNRGKAVVDTALDTSIQEISRSYESFTEDSLDIYRLSDAVKNDILKMDADLCFLSDLGDKLKVYFQQLKDIKEEFLCFSGKNAGAGSEDAGKIAERYTMQKEREIHQEIIGAERIPNSGNDGKDDDEFLIIQKDVTEDNIDLNSKILSGEDGGEDNLGDNVELF